MGDQITDSAARRARVLGLLRIEPPESIHPVRAIVGERQPWQGVWRRHVTLIAGDGHEVPCFFLTPVEPAPWPSAVIAVHQHNGEFEWGKSEVIGLAGNPDLAYGLDLALAGIPVLAPDLSGFEERMTDRSAPARAEQLDAWARITQGTTLQGRHTEDIALATSWLAGHDDIHGPIGVIGHSLGGQVAFFSLACDRRIRAGVISCGLGTLESFDAHSILHNPAWYVPGLRAAGDAQTVARAASVQSIRVIAGRTDPLFPIDGVQAVVSSFDDDVCTFETFEGGHEFSPGQQHAAIAWLSAALRESGAARSA